MTQGHDDTGTNPNGLNKQRTIRIMVLGDEKVGKSSLISALVSQHASERVPRVLHDIVIPTEDTRENVVISLHDTSSNANDVMEVIKTMNRSDTAIVVYDVSRSISSQRLGYWLDLLKVTKVIPVVLLGNKCDLLPGGSEVSRVQSVMRNYKFIVHNLECSARTLTNVKKAFGFAQKAVLYPMTPLYDAEKKQLQPKFINVLQRIFRLFDIDRDGIISREELHEYQNVCFKTRMKPEDMNALLELVTLARPSGVSTTTHGLLFDGFMYLSELAIEKSKPEHCWQVLRTLGYTDTLELEIPQDHLDIPQDSSFFEICELSSTTSQFLKAIYEQYAPLTHTTVEEIFLVVPCEKRPKWANLPQESILDHAAWIALWSLEMAIHPRRALEQLYYLGFVDTKSSQAVDIRRRQTSRHRNNSNVIRCLLFGSPQCGKTYVTNSNTCFSFLSPEPFEPTAVDGDTAIQAYQHLLHNVRLVSPSDTISTEKTLIISEVSEGVIDHEHALAIAKFVHADIVCYMFDGTENDSFGYVDEIQKHVSDTVPCLYVCSIPTPIEETTSLIALDECTKHCLSLRLKPPLTICLSTKDGFDQLYHGLVSRALNPNGALPFTKKKAAQKFHENVLIGVGTVLVGLVSVGIAYTYRDELRECLKNVGWLWQPSIQAIPASKE